MKFQAFYNIPELKEHYLGRLKWRMDMDHLMRGATGNFAEQGKKFRGCAVACSMESYSHKAYETEWQVPEWLARLEDAIFENMTVEMAATWPYDFADAINVGSDLETIRVPFILVILEKNLETLNSIQIDPSWPADVKAAIAGSKAAVE